MDVRSTRRHLPELFDIQAFNGVSMAGRTDQWILTELAVRHGIAIDGPTRQRLRDCYLLISDARFTSPRLERHPARRQPAP